MLSYKQLLPVGSILIIISLSFTTGVLFANWPYEYFTLMAHNVSDEKYTAALNHYITWVSDDLPLTVVYLLHGIIGLGFVGAFIRIYKPSEETTYFEYGTLVAMVACVSVYVTNIRMGIYSCLYNEWGEVDQNTGLAVIAASASIVVFVSVGVILTQISLIVAQNEDTENFHNLKVEELQEKIASLEAQLGKPAGKSAGKQAAAATETSAETTSAEPVSTKATKTKAKSKSKKT